jgi:hypothetical protein
MVFFNIYAFFYSFLYKFRWDTPVFPAAGHRELNGKAAARATARAK